MASNKTKHEVQIENLEYYLRRFATLLLQFGDDEARQEASAVIDALDARHGLLADTQEGK